MCTVPLRMCDGSETSKCFLCDIRRNFTDKAYDFYGISKSAALTAGFEILFRISGSKFEMRKFQLHIFLTAARFLQSTPRLNFGTMHASPVPFGKVPLL